MDTATLEQMIRQLLLEKLGGAACHGVKALAPANLRLTEADRMDTGQPGDKVYTHDLLTLEESPRLGVGLMEMWDTTFPWTLRYDEIDYVLEGRLEVIIQGQRVAAGPGELIYIPKDSSIQFSVAGHARFLYFVYPADWQKQ